MKLRHLPLFKYKLLNPCKKILQLFKFRLRRPLFIRSLQFRRRRPNIHKTTHEGRFSKILSVFHLKEKREMDRATEPTSFSDALHHQAPYPSPLTPAYVRMSGATRNELGSDDQDDVEDACRSFEKYLIDMIVEEGKTRDLVDVEQLLYYWKNLTSPVFIDLVCRFYGELCKDLFSDSRENDIGTPNERLR